MARHIVFFYVPDMGEVNDQARTLLTKQSREQADLEVEEVPCEPSMRRIATCPFIRDESRKANYYGVQGIEAFLQDLRHEKTRDKSQANGNHRGVQHHATA